MDYRGKKKKESTSTTKKVGRIIVVDIPEV